MTLTNRRSFLKKAVVGGGLIAGAAGTFSRRISAAGETEFNRIAYRQLGSTGYIVSEIGFGAMNTRDAELVHAAIDSGINYLDTAHSYMNGVNEEIIGSVMKTKRDRVFLTTKIKFDNNGIDIKDMPGMLEKSVKRLQTDHVDLVLLHVTDRREHILRNDIMNIFQDYKKKGLTRFIGVSTHSNQAEVLNAAVESKHWEAALVGYNYYSPPNVPAAIKRAREAGLAIIGMKNLLDTKSLPWKNLRDFRKNPSETLNLKQALIKWVLEDRYVDATIPGMTSFEQLADDIAVMGTKFTFDDNRSERRYSFNTVDDGYCRGVAGCTGCREKCPKGVQIHEINRCLRYAYGYGDYGLAMENYSSLPRSSRLDICGDCDECAVVCVNGLNLTDRIRKAHELFI